MLATILGAPADVFADDDDRAVLEIRWAVGGHDLLLALVPHAERLTLLHHHGIPDPRIGQAAALARELGVEVLEAQRRPQA